ncbi:hypothetical protein Q7P37_010217 [Cladosporium fusiforme]
MTTNGDLSRVFSAATDASETSSTVIVGAGIIGCATAYYLSQSGHTKPDTIHLVEASEELFASASGKAGGFLTADWFGPATASLGSLSFDLHKKLAERDHGHEKWGYSKSTGTTFFEGQSHRGQRGEQWVTAGGSRAEAASGHEFVEGEGGPAWLRRGAGEHVDIVGEESSVAQVDPIRLSQHLLRTALLRGVRLHQPSRPMKVSRDPVTGCISALRVRHNTGADHKIPCTRLVIACGAWTSIVFSTLFPCSRVDIPVSHLAGYSLVVKSPRWKKEHEEQGCHAVFTSTNDGFSPEIFSRVGEEIYIAGLNDQQMPLPDLATDVRGAPARAAELLRVAERLLAKDKEGVFDLEVVREGICLRPVTDSGNPILARVPDEDLGGVETKDGVQGGVFIAAGHGPWGISFSLGTGKVMQEMIEGEDLSADVSLLGL